ncbi:MAG: hypothetical protein A3F16_02930 [Deltaproteobacteria bacterium RIFCSPHIGHO2_12_FULL_43_9]|nr:MAG: hypothetical protein A3F16_02930 [Deltaproteobacteria bacterium RIFCSPHIGHO2_12_FULL_43_9]
MRHDYIILLLFISIPFAGCQGGDSHKNLIQAEVKNIKSAEIKSSQESLQASSKNLKESMMKLISESRVEEGMKAILSRYDGKMTYNADMNNPNSIRYLDDPATFVLAELVVEGQLYRRDFLSAELDLTPLQKDLSGLLQVIPTHYRELNRNNILPAADVSKRLYHLVMLQKELDGTSSEAPLEQLVRMHNGEANHPATEAALMILFEGHISSEEFVSALKHFSTIPDENLQISTALFREDLYRRAATDPRLSFLRISETKK